MLKGIEPMAQFSAESRAALIRLLRDTLDRTSAQDIADDFGQRANLGIGYFDSLGGDNLKLQISNLVIRAQQLQKESLLINVIVSWRSDLREREPIATFFADGEKPKTKVHATETLMIETADDLWKRGQVYAEGGDPDRALTTLNQAISIDPSKAHYYASRGAIFLDQNQLADALADFTRAIDLKKRRQPEYFLARATTYIKRGWQMKIEGQHGKERFFKGLEDVDQAYYLWTLKTLRFFSKEDIYLDRGGRQPRIKLDGGAAPPSLIDIFASPTNFGDLLTNTVFRRAEREFVGLCLRWVIYAWLGLGDHVSEIPQLLDIPIVQSTFDNPTELQDLRSGNPHPYFIKEFQPKEPQ